MKIEFPDERMAEIAKEIDPWMIEAFLTNEGNPHEFYFIVWKRMEHKVYYMEFINTFMLIAGNYALNEED